jgi:hypothetical protein
MFWFLGLVFEKVFGKFYILAVKLTCPVKAL